MFHILDGDATAVLLMSVDIPGRKQPWGDLLMEGPLAANPLDEAVLRKRGAYLEERFGIPVRTYAERMGASANALALARASPEVVLWTGEDLLAQTNTLYLLDALSTSKARLMIVAPDSGPLRGKPHELKARFDARAEVSPARLDLAKRAWRALLNPQPLLLARIANEADFTAWPALQAGLRAHLARFPSPRTGLGAIEEAALAALGRGAATVAEVVEALAAMPEWGAYGAGDAQVGGYLRQLARGAPPLVKLSGSPEWKNMPAWRFSLTEDGRAVLAGREDAVRMRGVDHWIGGVHLRGMSDVWRYDREKGALTKK